MKVIGQGFSASANHVLARASWATERLQPFATQSFRIQAVPIVIDLSVGNDGLLAAAPADKPPDVTLTLPLTQLPMVLSGGMSRLMNHVRIEGNAEFAEAIGFVFRNLSWDVEEDLSRLVGDIPAHRITSGARELIAAQGRALTGFGDSLAEYLREETGLLAPRREIAAFGGEVAQLRDATARLEKRLERLVRPRQAVRLLKS